MRSGPRLCGEAVRRSTATVGTTRSTEKTHRRARSLRPGRWTRTEWIERSKFLAVVGWPETRYAVTSLLRPRASVSVTTFEDAWPRATSLLPGTMKHAVLFPASLVAVGGCLLGSPASASLADLLAEAEIAQEMQREYFRNADHAETATGARAQEREQPDEVSDVLKKLPEADQPQEKAEEQEATSEEEKHRSEEEETRESEEAAQHEVEDVKMVVAEEGFGGVEHSEKASGQKEGPSTSARKEARNAEDVDETGGDFRPGAEVGLNVVTAALGSLATTALSLVWKVCQFISDHSAADVEIYDPAAAEESAETS